MSWASSMIMGYYCCVCVPRYIFYDHLTTTITALSALLSISCMHCARILDLFWKIKYVCTFHTTIQLSLCHYTYLSVVVWYPHMFVSPIHYIYFRKIIIIYDHKQYLYAWGASIKPVTDANTHINDAHFRFLSTGMGWYLVFQ